MHPDTVHERNVVVVMSVLTGVMVTLVGLVLSGLLAAEAGRSQALSSKRYSDRDIEDTRDFWDEERQRRARPQAPGGGVQTDPRREGPEQASQPLIHRSPATVQARVVPRPYTNPASAIRGKIFFETPDGVAECSGTVVDHPSGNMVWTAAHCLHGGRGKGFHDRVTFVPAYNGNGATRAEREPFGRWPARRTTVSGRWAAKADPEGRDTSASPFDYGAFLVEPRAGRSLEETVGRGAEILWNPPRHLRVESFGYPGDEPFDGGSLYTCASPTTDFREDGWPGPEMMWMGCTMTGGSSGGGWFAEVDGRSVLVSNVSLSVRTSQARTMAGPYLDSAAREVYEAL